MKKNIDLSKVESRKSIFLTAIEKETENSKFGTSPTQQFLKSINDELKQAIENGLSYEQISKLIVNTFSINLSSATIRAYAYNHLNVNRRARTKSKDDVSKNIEKTTTNDEVVKKVENSNVVNSNNSSTSIAELKKMQNSKTENF